MTPRAEAPIHAAHAERFRQIIARGLGLAFEDSKVPFLGEVLQRRLGVGGQDADAYLQHLDQSWTDDDLRQLSPELTVSETYFFRNIDQFHALESLALPERIRAQQPRRSLRLLSAGCASGEEAYSLAIIARELLPDPTWELWVRGVDVNPAMVERAQRARYTSWALREMPPGQGKWFRPAGRELALDESIRATVRFERRNLSREEPDLWQPESHDVVFCRNVLMYLTVECAQALVARIARSLAPGGYLFLGHAETLRGLSNAFHLRHTHGTFYYQRKGAMESAAAIEAPAGPRPLSPALSEAVAGSTSWVETIQHASDRIRTLAQSQGSPSPARGPLPRPELGAILDLLRVERYSDALGIVHQLPADAAADPDVLLLEAVLLTHGGQLAQARETCERLLAIDELSAGAHYVLALCCESAGDRSGAVDHDRVAIYLDPTFAMPRLHLGLLSRRAGELEAARRELSQALLLLQREETSRLILFGGGFKREALSALCTAELAVCGGSA